MRFIPNDDEKRKIERIVTKVRTQLEAFLPKTEILLGGSVAKGTWVSGLKDIDFFVKFKDEKNISNILEGALINVFSNVKRLKGSRDYFQVDVEGMMVEVVPIRKIVKVGEAENITDMSPLHVDWVIKHAKGLEDEVRKLKQFFIAQNLYGAESYLAGFSGYVLEILTVYYGSFEKVLQAVGKWRVPVVIDASKFYKGKDVFFHLNKSKTVSPLIVVDPVDKFRNAAAAVSKESYERLKKVARNYCKKPTEDFFVVKELSKEGLPAKSVFLEIYPVVGKKDVVGCKLRKIIDSLLLGLGDFGVVSWEWQFLDCARVIITLKKLKVGDEIRKGPPIKLKEASLDFKKLHQNAYEKEGILYAVVPRGYVTVTECLEKLINCKYVSERCERIDFFIIDKV